MTTTEIIVTVLLGVIFVAAAIGVYSRMHGRSKGEE